MSEPVREISFPGVTWQESEYVEIVSTGTNMNWVTKVSRAGAEVLVRELSDWLATDPDTGETQQEAEG